jgi:hypothetical protein
MAVSSYRYQTRRSDEPLRTKLVELARSKPRFGYRRLHVLLGCSGEQVNHKRLHRVYREAGLMIRRKKRKNDKTMWSGSGFVGSGVLVPRMVLSRCHSASGANRLSSITAEPPGSAGSSQSSTRMTIRRPELASASNSVKGLVAQFFVRTTVARAQTRPLVSRWYSVAEQLR